MGLLELRRRTEIGSRCRRLSSVPRYGLVTCQILPSRDLFGISGSAFLRHFRLSLPQGPTYTGGDYVDRIVQDDLQRAIERGLRMRGRFAAELEPSSAQGVVDAQWAAHRAARSVGIRVHVTVREEPASTGHAIAVINVTPRAADGLLAASGRSARPGRGS